MTNCRGTILYWLGEQKKDKVASSAQMEDFLGRKYVKTDRPKAGDIAVWYPDMGQEQPSYECADHILHVGLVEKVSNQIRIRSRLGSWGVIDVLSENEIMPAINHYSATDVRYYTRKHNPFLV